MKSSLVNIANRVTPHKEEDAEKSPKPSRANIREMRYRLRSEASKAIPRERVAKCGRHTIKSTVSVHSGDYSASFSGLETCGSIWTCPVCAAKISEGRRKELDELISLHKKAKGRVFMSAFTIPHDRMMTAKELRDTVAKSWQKMQAGAPWKRAGLKINLLGIVRALEITHGGNGWHPHLHVLFFIGPDVEQNALDEFGIFIFERWAKIIDKAGYGECNPSIFRFEETHSSSEAGDYVTKWGADKELTQGHTKRAKGGGRTPWQLLEDMGKGEHYARMLFREYAAAFKGARQLTWSRGIRERYGLNEISDEDICLTSDQAEEKYPIIGVLKSHVFRKIAKRGLAARLLSQVEQHKDWQRILIWLRSLEIDPDEPNPRERKIYDT